MHCYFYRGMNLMSECWASINTIDLALYRDVILIQICHPCVRRAASLRAEGIASYYPQIVVWLLSQLFHTDQLPCSSTFDNIRSMYCYTHSRNRRGGSVQVSARLEGMHNIYEHYQFGLRRYRIAQSREQISWVPPLEVFATPTRPHRCRSDQDR